MFNWKFGLIVSVILVLIFVVLVGYLAIVVISILWTSWHHIDREITHDVPGLGEFTSDDGEFWCGEAEYMWFGEPIWLQIYLSTAGQPPTEVQATLVRDVLNELPRLVMQSREYLLAHEDCGWLEGGAARFKPYGFSVEDGSSLELTLDHPADDNFDYTVEFRSGLPVSCRREHLG